MKIGFIRCGNMASAMMVGILKSGIASAKDVFVSDLDVSKLEKMNYETGVQAITDNKKVAEEADVLFLAVKPQYYDEVTAELKDYITSDMIVVTIAPGKTLAYMAERIGADKKVTELKGIDDSKLYSVYAYDSRYVLINQ